VAGSRKKNMAGLSTNPSSRRAAEAATVRTAGEVQTALDNSNRGIQAGSGNAWSPSSWKSKPVKQSVNYEDENTVEKALKKLESLPPLVTAAEVSKLRASLKEVALGKAFLLQGGMWVAGAVTSGLY